MKTYQFKELEIEHKDSWLKRTISSKHFKKTIITSIITGIAGYAMFYFGQENNIHEVWNDEALNNTLMGVGVGIFITNSPCARGRC